ncbi:hypothetical protein B0T14DRAFT_528546 [Immersiella caudata]|uniref:Uncharacterized protein n=1 Tax=Immersiella caudata TaxID=314043 RepID=A0AA39WFL2_9PEZI|nr:hypothetical protein B0T14DRAFT_528546 [Immersiella caudata]
MSRPPATRDTYQRTPRRRINTVSILPISQNKVFKHENILRKPITLQSTCNASSGVISIGSPRRLSLCLDLKDMMESVSKFGKEDHEAEVGWEKGEEEGEIRVVLPPLFGLWIKSGGVWRMVMCFLCDLWRQYYYCT